MTGCAAAIAAAQRFRDAEARCPALAYGLHLRGGKCRRVGGTRVCGECAGDVVPLNVPSDRSGALLARFRGQDDP